MRPRSLAVLATIAALSFHPTLGQLYAADDGTQLRMNGEAFHACTVVFGDFSKHLLRDAGELGELNRYLSDIANYDVEVRSEHNSYEVVITPTQHAGFPFSVAAPDIAYRREARIFKKKLSSNETPSYLLQRQRKAHRSD